MLREARVLMPDRQFIYVADNEAFPYGDWKDSKLLSHMLKLFGNLIDKWSPELIIIACNTASTLAIHALRERFPDQKFVGTVPAVKPAAERTRSGLVSILATPGTVERQYTRELIEQYGRQCHVRLVGSTRLAELAENYMRGGFTDEAAVREEIMPCFIERNSQRTDIVVLACTHYPFLVNRMRKMAPWPVDWIETSEAIARRALSLLPPKKAGMLQKDSRDEAYFTGGMPDASTSNLLLGFGLKPTSS